ncbi:SIMPL domain-containing protein [Candidatus Colwellia aromaticivorans]|uniref:SIMPL domain-containing protein n=1 Tax=Candidatus Colwellia aromaticivorans TaxID=2267621 RepID=UPI000DF25711|nr:SIMPL domain-containing protein [Candidatus Colwellia aromaticivorans]
MTKFLMSYFISTLAIITLILSGSSMAYNGETPNIEVKGQASVLAVPDRFSLSISIVERGRHTDKIRAVVDHKSNQVVQVAKSLGIKNHEINSARVTLRVVEEKPSITVEGVEVSQRVGNSSFPNNQHSKVYVGANAVNNQNNIKPKYFELRRTISINFSSIKDYDQFLNNIIKLGVSHISPLAMSVEDTEKHYQQALVQAINNAKKKAIQIASHSNVALGKLLYVKELSSNYYRPRMSSAMMSAEVTPNHNSQVGNQVINASVLVKFSIQE